jgi:ATP-dependent protease ClpP protease subunit
VYFYISQHKERILFIGETINEETANNLLTNLLYLDGLDPTKDLYFFINCLGGDVNFLLVLYIQTYMEKLEFLLVPFSCVRKHVCVWMG